MSNNCWCEIEIKADALHSIDFITNEIKSKLDPSGYMSEVQYQSNETSFLELEVLQENAGKILEIVRAASAGSALKYSVKFSF